MHDTVRFPQTAARNGALRSAIDRGLGILPAKVAGAGTIGQVLWQRVHNGDRCGQGMVPGALIVIGSRLQFEIHYPLIGIQIVGAFRRTIVTGLAQGLGDAGLVADHQQRVAPVPPVGVVRTKGAASIGSVGLLAIPDRAVDIGTLIKFLREAT